MPLRSSL